MVQTVPLDYNDLVGISLAISYMLSKMDVEMPKDSKIYVKSKEDYIRLREIIDRYLHDELENKAAGLI